MKKTTGNQTQHNGNFSRRHKIGAVFVLGAAAIGGIGLGMAKTGNTAHKTPAGITAAQSIKLDQKALQNTAAFEAGNPKEQGENTDTALAANRQAVQGASIDAAQGIAKQIQQAPDAAPYKQTYVGRMTPSGTPKPEMYEYYDPKQHEIVVDEINMPDGDANKFNDLQFTFQVNGKTASTMDGAARKRQLTASDFSGALSHAGDLSLLSATVGTPNTTSEYTLTINPENNAMSLGTASNTELVTPQNAGVVGPFTQSIHETASTLRQDFGNYK